MKIVVGNNEITNPVAKLVIGISAYIFLAGLLAILTLLILGIMGLITGFLTFIGVLIIATFVTSVPLALFGFFFNKNKNKR